MNPTPMSEYLETLDGRHLIAARKASQDLRRATCDLEARATALLELTRHARTLADKIDLALSSAPPLSACDKITEQVSLETGVPVEDMRSAQTCQRVFLARAEAMRRIRAVYRVPLDRIGDYFGGRDHSTVAMSIKRAESRIRGSAAE